MVNTQSAQDLLDEISEEYPTTTQHLFDEATEKEVEAELHIAMQQELRGNLSPTCAQALIDSV
jgi:hypothetical protein